MAFGARGSGRIVLARYVLDGLGLERDRDVQAVFLDAAGDGPRMVMDGTVAAVARPERLHPGVRRYLVEIGLTR